MSDSRTTPNTDLSEQPTTLPVAPTELTSLSAGSPRPPLDQIGNYRLAKLLGSGGMGEVWLGQHVEHENLLAAVKFIRADHVDRGMHDRFLRERASLVRLRHENIVKVSDLGVTANNVPYLLMEYVDGKAIDVYCDTHCLSVARRLALFLQVCRAVQHAHGLGLIHRDLKPANILVTEVEEKGGRRAVAKVIDFGIARAMESDEVAVESGSIDVNAADPLLTQTGMFIGSLLYASPEQLLAQPLDIRTDVYSLGTILYQLLSGTLPITTQEAQALLREAKAEMLDRHASTSRTPPSVKVSKMAKTSPQKLAKWAEARGLLANQLVALLADELDWITLKAIESDRGRRYRSVEALAEDVERYLNDEVVEARRPDWKYRAGKKWRRHRRQIVTGVVIVGVLVGVLFGLHSLDQKAQTEARRAAAERIRAEELQQEFAKTSEQQKAEILRQQKEVEVEKKKASAFAEREKERQAAETMFALPINGEKVGENWRLIKINGRDFVDYEDIGNFYGLGAVKREEDHFDLSLGPRSLRGAMNSDEFFINNLKFILSYPMVGVQDRLLMSRMDLTKIIEPVLRPSKIKNAGKVDTVILDPGKGGAEDGEKSALGIEKDFTLDVAQRARTALMAAGYKVVMTRDSDVAVPVPERVRQANQYANGLLISIHFSAVNPAETGIETYTLAPIGVPSMDNDGPEIADLDPCPGNANDAQNIALATALHAALVMRTRMYDCGILRNRTEIIRDALIPAVMVVGGCLKKEEDARLIATPAYREQLALGILQAVQNYRRAVGTSGSAGGSPPKSGTPRPGQ